MPSASASPRRARSESLANAGPCAVEAALGAAAAAGLRTRGRALLKRGAILKEGFGGFKRWSHRWLELELELDLTADGFRLAAVPEINRWFGGS